LFVVLTALVLTSAAQTESPAKSKEDISAERRAMDTALFNTLREVINRGVDLYNEGNSAGCYRVFEGSLRTIGPLLKHHPAMQKMIDRSLGSAERDPVAWRRAFTLRRALDKVRAELNPKKKPSERAPSLRPEDRKGKKPDSHKEAEKLPLPHIEQDDQDDKNER
jgi:hypothetical protein